MSLACLSSIDVEVVSYVCRQLARSLGEAGEIEPETEGILIEHDVDYAEFSNDVRSCDLFSARQSIVCLLLSNRTNVSPV